MKIGVLALQGTFIEHVHSVKKLGADAVEVRRPDELAGVDGVIIPGGESTTITHLMDYYGLVRPLQAMAKGGTAFLGTCAGMICMARDVGSPVKLQTLELMDIRVNRNAFGRQVSSFEQPLDIPVLGNRPFPGLFIRGPVIEGVGNGVEILARLENGTPVAARQDRLIATAFHPELMDDLRLHGYFLDVAGGCSEYRKAADSSRQPVEIVLFICVHNSARSQMAEAYFNHYAGSRAHAVSAGTNPSGSVNPQVVGVMAEEGIDISRNEPKLLTPALLAAAAHVIGMGCGVMDACPSRHIQAEDWQLADPTGRNTAEIRIIRDEIRSRVKALLERMGIDADAGEISGRG